MGRRGHAQRVPTGDPALDTAVARAQDGDETAFAAVYRLVHPGLLGYLRGIAGDEAEDIAAAAWREIARELPRFRGDGRGFRGWTASIARRHALDRPRRGGASARRPGHSPEALVARLPRAQAEAVLLRHAVRLDEPAVARVMRRPRPVVRVLARRGLRSLARLLGTDEVTHDVARTLGEPG
ncbi:RNA polymerase sigma factor [Streptomyces sp. HUCO-GS316]|uniref:RNA polymerase sigma factor n=1 Tax=Streptomyces sp. HUCO-GS316 TaxID=2692198 RepID=UPI0019280979|nr:sigma factor [Streptomyces sp. HUCO-GS316]